MQAIIYDRYGGPERLRLAEVSPPTPTEEQVLVRVHASSANALDWHNLRGKPYLARLTEGLLRPRDGRPGVDVAGVVEAVGASVTDLRVGDRVVGNRGGAFGELVAGATFVRLADEVSFADAATLPCAGTTALQAVRDRAAVESGQHVLVTGAGGGVGTFAVQIARAMGATVTAVTSRSKAEMVRSIGATTVLEHGADLAAAGPFDAIIDVAADRSLGALGRGLVPGGRVVFVGPGQGDWLGPINRLVAGVVRTKLGRGRFVPFLASVTKPDLATLVGMVADGRIRPVIQATYGLAEVPAAMRDLETNGTAGKLVIRVREG